MLPAPDFKSLISETAIIVESAHAAAESFVRHGIVPSLDIDEVVRFLDEAGELLAKMTHLSGAVGPIFHAREAANDNDVRCTSRGSITTLSADSLRQHNEHGRTANRKKTKH